MLDRQPARKLSLEDFDILGDLGSGSYGDVQLAINIKTGERVVLKKVDKEQLQKEGKMSQVYLENYILGNYSKKHPGILGFYGTFQDPRNVYFVLEYCPYGDLEGAIRLCHKHYAKDLDPLIRSYVFQLCKTVTFFHQNGIAHLDIKVWFYLEKKPKNIVIDRRKNLKIIDYATCYIFDESLRPPRLRVNLPSFDQEKCTFVGTPQYVSPEMLETSKGSREADMWAIGCIIYEFYYGSPPFDELTDNAVFERIQACNVNYQDPPDREVPMDAKDLISKLLVIDPMQRLSSQVSADGKSQLLDHPFFDQTRNFPHWVEDLNIPETYAPYFLVKSEKPISFVIKNNDDSDETKPSPQQTTRIQSNKSLHPKELPHGFVWVKQKGIFKLPKSCILMVDQQGQRIFINDLKKQQQYKLRYNTTIEQNGNSFKIETLTGEEPFCIEFSDNFMTLDWVLLIRQAIPNQ